MVSAKVIRLCYRWVKYLPMLFAHSIVSACFTFKTSLIRYDRFGFFDNFDFPIFFCCVASVPKLSFASVSYFN